MFSARVEPGHTSIVGIVWIPIVRPRPEDRRRIGTGCRQGVESGCRDGNIRYALFAFSLSLSFALALALSFLFSFEIGKVVSSNQGSGR